MYKASNLVVYKHRCGFQNFHSIKNSFVLYFCIALLQFEGKISSFGSFESYVYLTQQKIFALPVLQLVYILCAKLVYFNYCNTRLFRIIYPL